MPAYTTVDDVAARFPSFKRSGAPQAIASLARSANIVTVTFAAPHGATPGWSAVISGTAAAGATVFDGAFTVASAAANTLTYAQQAANDTATGGLASLAPPGKTGDGQIQEWITERAAYIDAIANSRGYVLTQLPAATAADAQVILRNLNKLSAQVLLGEVVAAQMGITGQWLLLDTVRSEAKDLLTAFRAGYYDKLFLATAGTQDAGPQAGGFVPCRPIFRRDEQF